MYEKEKMFDRKKEYKPNINRINETFPTDTHNIGFDTQFLKFSILKFGSSLLNWDLIKYLRAGKRMFYRKKIYEPNINRLNETILMDTHNIGFDIKFLMFNILKLDSPVLIWSSEKIFTLVQRVFCRKNMNQILIVSTRRFKRIPTT